MPLYGPALMLTGERQVIANLNKAIDKIGNDFSRDAMTQAALLVKARSVRLTPVKYGDLRKSSYINVYKTGQGFNAEIGYTAAYAVYVHEIDKAYKAPGTQWKFLETALAMSQQEILMILKANMSVEGIGGSARRLTAIPLTAAEGMV